MGLFDALKDPSAARLRKAGMGIPGYFASVHRQCPDCIHGAPPSGVSRLFVDYNCLVHTCVTAIGRQGEGAAAEGAAEGGAAAGGAADKAIIRASLASLEQLIAAVGSAESGRDGQKTLTVYVAADGLPPVAKMAQQRRRRFASRMLSDASDDAVTAWDRNRITPGTAFARDLDAATHAFCKASRNNVCIEYSGTDEPGEGEHKIVQLIRDGRVPGRDVIYGLDADLIILSMLLGSEREASAAGGYPWLCRESTTSLPRGEEHRGTSSFWYVDVAALACRVIGSADHGIGTIDRRSVLNHVACSFLCGNDFLPHLSFLTVRGGWPQRCTQLAGDLQPLMRASGDVDWDGVLALLERLLPMEDAEMARLDAVYWAAVRQAQRPRQRADRDREQPSPSLTHPDDRHRAIRPGTPCWRLRYYAQLFGVVDAAEIKNVALEYAMGLQWNADYYSGQMRQTDKTAAWPYWHYPHAYGPTVADLRNAVLLHRHEITAMARGRPRVELRAWQHLAAVMPLANADLVPPEGRAYMRDPALGMLHQYPSACRLATYLRHRAWECEPMLPPMRVPGVRVRVAAT